MKLRYVAVLLAATAIPLCLIAATEHNARVQDSAYNAQKIHLLEAELKIGAVLQGADAQATLRRVSDLGRQLVKLEQDYRDANSDAARQEILANYVATYKEGSSAKDALEQSYQDPNLAVLVAGLKLYDLDHDRWQADLDELSSAGSDAKHATDTITDFSYRATDIYLDVAVEQMKYRQAHSGSLNGLDQEAQLQAAVLAELQKRVERLNQR